MGHWMVRGDQPGVGLGGGVSRLLVWSLALRECTIWIGDPLAPATAVVAVAPASCLEAVAGEWSPGVGGVCTRRLPMSMQSREILRIPFVGEREAWVELLGGDGSASESPVPVLPAAPADGASGGVAAVCRDARRPAAAAATVSAAPPPAPPDASCSCACSPSPAAAATASPATPFVTIAVGVVVVLAAFDANTCPGGRSALMLFLRVGAALVVVAPVSTAATSSSSGGGASSFASFVGITRLIPIPPARPRPFGDTELIVRKAAALGCGGEGLVFGERELTKLPLQLLFRLGTPTGTGTGTGGVTRPVTCSGEMRPGTGDEELRRTAPAAGLSTARSHTGTFCIPSIRIESLCLWTCSKTSCCRWVLRCTDALRMAFRLPSRNVSSIISLRSKSRIYSQVGGGGGTEVGG
jgi:hypothetical protein